jgi:hypothetical protein
LAAESTLNGAGTSESEMPRLDAFDEEFGREPVAILRGQRRKGRLRFSIFVALLLCAGAASALAFAWRNGDSWLPFDVQSASLPQLASREGADDQVVRLRRQVEALRKEIGDLTEAQQRATDTIASLRAEQDAREPAASAYWYSDLGALNFGIANPRPAGAAPARSARSEFRTRRRDAGGGGTPLSLEAPQ